MKKVEVVCSLLAVLLIMAIAGMLINFGIEQSAHTFAETWRESVKDNPDSSQMNRLFELCGSQERVSNGDRMTRQQFDWLIGCVESYVESPYAFSTSSGIVVSSYR